jgi:uncharacterized linocin/CFP29 family protein
MIHARPPEGLDAAILASLEAPLFQRARALMTARRILDFEGPIGAGIESLQVGPVRDAPLGDTGAKVSSRRAIPIPTAYASFELPRREIESAIASGVPLDASPGEMAAEQVALAEEQLIYLGAPELGIEGILTHPDTNRVTIDDWSQAGSPIADVIAAADALDAARMHGPFALVLAPARYNHLFRKYEGSDVLALDHLRRLASGGIYKSHALTRGGVLLSREIGPIVCAQDLTLTFLEVRPSTLRFSVSNAVILRLDEPRAACVLGEP